VNRLSFHCVHRWPGGFSIDAAFETSAQITAIVGPSGAGKTSVLAMIAGLAIPQQGTIRFGDATWLDTQHRVRVKANKRHVGFVFQDHLLFPHLNVQQNLLYGQRRRRGQPSGIELPRVVEVLELGDLLHRYPRNLSGGEKQRVALGRSLLSGPQLLLMDEPLASLDELLKQRILDYFERVWAEWHVPAIYVSHSAAEVRRLADWVIIMDQGRVICSGAAKDVLSGG
jgi:molybdate transport system ATP-binding protein